MSFVDAEETNKQFASWVVRRGATTTANAQEPRLDWTGSCSAGHIFSDMGARRCASSRRAHMRNVFEGEGRAPRV